MFKSWHYVDGSQVPGSTQGDYFIKIVDEEFSHTAGPFARGTVYSLEAVVNSVILAYHSRNLDVAYNLFLFIKRDFKNIGTFPTVINQYFNDIPGYHTYHSQVAEYHKKYDAMKAFW